MILKFCLGFLYFETQLSDYSNSDGEMTETKVVDLDKIYNVIVNDFFIGKHLWS